MFSGAFNGFNLADSTVPNGSLQLSIQGKSVFDTDADDDIVQMAAQRDQLRGARNIRGMMAPVMSKEVRGYEQLPCYLVLLLRRFVGFVV